MSMRVCEQMYERESMQRWISSGRERAVVNLWSEAFKVYYTENPELLTTYASDGEAQLMMNFMKSRRKGTKYYFIVVNPIELTELNLTLDYFKKKAIKAMSKRWIKRGIYTFEQRGTNDEDLGRGVHLNFVVETRNDKRPSEVQREFWSTFKNALGARLHVCVRRGHDPTNFIRYVLGEKEEGKLDLVAWDNAWRENVGLDEWYGDGAFIREFLGENWEDNESEGESEDELLRMERLDEMGEMSEINEEILTYGQECIEDDGMEGWL